MMSSTGSGNALSAEREIEKAMTRNESHRNVIFIVVINAMGDN